jgi:hypothetical protein
MFRVCQFACKFQEWVISSGVKLCVIERLLESKIAWDCSCAYQGLYVSP